MSTYSEAVRQMHEDERVSGIVGCGEIIDEGRDQSGIIRRVTSVVGGKYADIVRREVLDLGTPDGDEEEEALANAIVDGCCDEERRLFVAEAVHNMGFEWQNDLKFVMAAKLDEHGGIVDIL